MLDGKSQEETAASDDESSPALIPPKPNNNKSSRGLNQHFLDLFWKLADNEAGTRIAASLEIVKHVDSAHSSVSHIFNQNMIDRFSFLSFVCLGLTVELHCWSFGSGVGFKQRVCKTWVLYHISWDFKNNKCHQVV